MSSRWGSLGLRVYPRACGGTPGRVFRRPPRRGLSPRVRGNPPHWLSPLRCSGSIPAPCGGTSTDGDEAHVTKGLSPRVRGNPLLRVHLLRRGGSIPARAGEPLAHRVCCCTVSVYPRACGGTAAISLAVCPPRGLSPRVRGNPLPTGFAAVRYRSIPARAGEPRQSRWPSAHRGVYPRACGGTFPQRPRNAGARGLSPRVRGKPILTTIRGFQGGVYPRACGGTSYRVDGGIIASGLSPRVRGNPRIDVDNLIAVGSIPARAGEPSHPDSNRGQRWVYPRACGGT